MKDQDQDKDTDLNLKTDIAVLKTNLENIQKSYNNIDNHLRKLDSINTNLTRNTMRIEGIEKSIDSNKKDADLTRRENEANLKELRLELVKSSAESKSIVIQEVNKINLELTEFRDHIKENFERVYKVIEKNDQNISNHHEHDMKKIDDKFDVIQTKVEKLENWRWWAVGIGSSLLLVASYIF